MGTCFKATEIAPQRSLDYGLGDAYQGLSDRPQTRAFGTCPLMLQLWPVNEDCLHQISNQPQAKTKWMRRKACPTATSKASNAQQQNDMKTDTKIINEREKSKRIQQKLNSKLKRECWWHISGACVEWQHSHLTTTTRTHDKVAWR